MVNGGKARQETVSGPKGTGGGASGVEQADKDKTGNGNGKKGTRRENRSSNDGERTTDKRRVDNESKKKLKIGSWSVRGFATQDRKRLDIVEQVSEHDLDIVGIQESWVK